MMKKRNEILMVLIGATGAFLAASCSQPAQTGMTDGRARALVGVVVSLISLVIGGLALARSAGLIGTGSGRAGAIVALVLGLIGIILSVLHLSSSSTGGIGTGGGRAGAIIALVLGLIGAGLGGLTVFRSRRTT